MTYILVSKLLGFIALFVLCCLVLIWLTILRAQGLPLVTEDFPDLACLIIAVRRNRDEQEL